MNIRHILVRCIDQSEQIKLQLQKNSEATADSLGGDLRQAFKEVRAYQLTIVDRINEKLQNQINE